MLFCVIVNCGKVNLLNDIVCKKSSFKGDIKKISYFITPV